MPAETIRILIAGSLCLHALAHAIALSALIADSLGAPRQTRMAVRSWLLPRLTLRSAAAVGIALWAPASAGFLAAAAAFWGLVAAGEAWRHLALASSVVSILGIVVFSGVWPGSPSTRRSVLNTLVALTMDLAIIVTQLWLHWPPQAMSGT
jgi:hypothetical protein